MRIAADLVEANELRQLARLCGLDLAVVLAQLRWNPRQIETGVDLLLFGGEKQLSGLDLLEALLGER